MYTVEFEDDATIITSLDEQGDLEDLQVIQDERFVFLRQYDEFTDEFMVLMITPQQFKDIIAAQQCSEGAYYVRTIDK
ncbi:hypothetical protein CRP227_gp23 [Roseobacter phage CRP-227]|jgi:hypothetical protein|uniref:Uncharacterized protein n=3 Tax=Dynamenevirus TaxID=3425740 RepID=A0AAX3ZXH0_9CAUD|nr:hypothetical protein CRP114_gp25 [Roseobacter phage CRP-114]WMM95486.1 hypothetical protein CRP227_gp23 [Roseobacter phage CRP-227]WMM95641.1 hypothetical protein CRP361_gp23 [Roseobacter phage CRP-361]|tara:strand:+ start:323 stop:556 length:234 start_codon:yes stop_codon:yes gene_type:complete